MNPDLRPEKAFHVNAEGSRHFSKHYRMELAVYQKNYYDLAVSMIKNTGRIDFDSDNIRGLYSQLHWAPTTTGDRFNAFASKAMGR